MSDQNEIIVMEKFVHDQNECDHVVGYQHVKFGAHLVLKISDLEMPKAQVHVKFKYCPKCGAKIDWEAIKEACDEH